MLRVQGRAHVERVEGGGRARLAFDRFLGPEHGEDNVVSHHVKVPGDDRALVLVLDQHLMRLKCGRGITNCTWDLGLIVNNNR